MHAVFAFVDKYIPVGSVHVGFRMSFFITYLSTISAPLLLQSISSEPSWTWIDFRIYHNLEFTFFGV